MMKNMQCFEKPTPGWRKGNSAESRSLHPNGNSFTLIELLLVMTVIIILAALLLPAINKVRAKAKETICINNLKQMGYAAISYGNDSASCFPPNVLSSKKYHYWKYLSTYVGGPRMGTIPDGWSYDWLPKAMFCPLTTPRVGAYAALYSNATDEADCLAVPVFKIARLRWIEDPIVTKAPNFILMADARFNVATETKFENGHILTGWGDARKLFSFVHEGRGNAVFMDGHVKGLEMTGKYVHCRQYAYPVYSKVRKVVQAATIFNYRLYNGATCVAAYITTSPWPLH